MGRKNESEYDVELVPEIELEEEVITAEPKLDLNIYSGKYAKLNKDLSVSKNRFMDGHNVTLKAGNEFVIGVVDNINKSLRLNYISKGSSSGKRGHIAGWISPDLLKSFTIE